MENSLSEKTNQILGFSQMIKVSHLVSIRSWCFWWSTVDLEEGMLQHSCQVAK